MATIAERLREAMDLRGYKQADLVEKTGINKGALSCYISGKYKPKQNNIYLLAKALDVSEAWLMGVDAPLDRTSIPFGAWQDQDEFEWEQRQEEKERLSDFMHRMRSYYDAMNIDGQEHILQTCEDMMQVDRFRKDKK